MFSVSIFITRYLIVKQFLFNSLSLISRMATILKACNELAAYFPSSFGGWKSLTTFNIVMTYDLLALCTKPKTQVNGRTIVHTWLAHICIQFEGPKYLHLHSV